MRKLIFLIFTLHIILLYSVKAQISEWIAEDFPGSTFINIIEKDGDILGAISNGPLINPIEGIPYQLTIVKFNLISMNSSFELDEVITLPFEDNFSTSCIKFINETRTWLLLQSSYISPNLYNYRVLLYNENFEIITSQTLDSLGAPTVYFIDSYEGNTLVLGTVQSSPYQKILFLNYNHSNPNILPPIILSQSTPDSMYLITSMAFDSKTGDMLIYHFNGLAVLDTNLNVLKYFDYTTINTFTHGTIEEGKGEYYSHGATLQENSGLRWLVYQKYDSLFNIVIADTFGVPNHDNYPFILKSLDYKNKEIVIGGHLDGPSSNFGFIGSIKRFYLAKFDDSGNRLWYHEYGGDRAYLMVGLQLLENRQCLSYGFITDSTSDYRHAYVMLVNEDGDISATHQAEKLQEPFIQIINPCYNSFCLINKEEIPIEIKLYDCNGTIIHSQESSTYWVEINLENLPSNIYHYLISYQEKKMKTGSWVMCN